MLPRRGENVYTDPSLLGVAGVLDVNPELSPDGASASPLTMHGPPQSVR